MPRIPAKNNPLPLTPKQRNIMLWLINQIKTRGIPPSIAETQKRFGWASPYTVTCKMNALERKGLITIEPGRARGIKIVWDRCASMLGITTGAHCPLCGNNAPRQFMGLKNTP